MSWQLALTAGGCTVFIPGWAAVTSVAVAAAPRLVWRLYQDRDGS